MVWPQKHLRGGTPVSLERAITILMVAFWVLAVVCEVLLVRWMVLEGPPL